MTRRFYRALGTLTILWIGAQPWVAAERPAQDLAAGKAAYEQSCARCHGATGAGDGVDAKRFYPRPRDLTMGVYKFRSTASGTPPTDEDLFETITRGLPGSNMPDWQHLPEETRWHLVDYLKSLSPVFAQTAPEPVAVADDPGPKRADLAKGQALYTQLGCASCHGAAGRANGMSAATLVDDWGKPIRPANLTQGWSYRGWPTPRDVMLRVLTGIDGAGMPSYTGAVSPDDAWHLAYYVASLQEPPHEHQIARAAVVTGGLPQTLDDARWEHAEWTMVRLRNAVSSDGEWVDPPTVIAVSFQVLTNDEAMVLRVMWDDPSEERGSAADAFAMVLKSSDIQGDAVTLHAWPYEGSPRLDVSYWSAGRPEAFEVVAASFDEVVERSGLSAPLASAAAYEDGRWQLVMQRPLRPTSPVGAASLDPAVLSSVAFAVWDGGTPGTRAVSPWVDVTFPQHEHKSDH
jgi:cytochrome c oxidase cbb3-type subunit 2